MISRKYFTLTVPVPFQVLILYSLSLLLLIGFWRFVFLVNHISEIQLHNINLYLQSFVVALRLDAVVASYLCLPLLLIVFLPYVGCKSKIFRKLFLIYSGITFFLYSLISIIDIEFYKELGTHLNILAWQTNAYSKEVWQFAWREHPVFFYIISIFFIV